MNRERIKDRIADIASRPAHVRFEELENLLENHIRFAITKYNHHGKSSHHAFTVVDGERFATFSIPTRRPFLLQRYVREFVKAMVTIGLYDPED